MTRKPLFLQLETTKALKKLKIEKKKGKSQCRKKWKGDPTAFEWLFISF